jgi:hypothetical protein
MFIKQIISSNLNLKQINSFHVIDRYLQKNLFELLSNQCM